MFNDQISLVEFECNVKTEEIDSLRFKLNHYAKHLKIQQQRNRKHQQVHKKRVVDATYWNRICWGGFIAGEAALCYFAAPAFVAVNGVAAIGCFCGWGYNYFFADVKPGVTTVNVVTRNNRRIKKRLGSEKTFFSQSSCQDLLYKPYTINLDLIKFFSPKMSVFHRWFLT